MEDFSESVSDKRPESSQEFEYGVALSFAGEQRAYVEQVAKVLREKGVTVFYDEFEEVKMWGRDLASFLEQLFRKRARYCVMFVSAEYARKRWPRWEGKAAIARLVEEKEEYILPVRFDDTELPGLSPTIKYVDAARLRPEELAARILQKLGRKDRPQISSSNTYDRVNFQSSEMNPNEIEKIAIEFVKQKKPDWKLDVEAVKRKDGRWVVRGSVSKKEVTWRTRSMITEKWAVEIEGDKVVDYEFTPGSGFTIA